MKMQMNASHKKYKLDGKKNYLFGLNLMEKLVRLS